MGDEGISFRPSEQVRLITAQIDEFIEGVIAPLEEAHPRFLDEDAERHLVDGEGRPVEEYLAVRDAIQERSVEAGLYTMALPERVGGGGLSALEYTMVLEHLYDRDPRGFHDLLLDRLSINAAVLPLAEDDYQRREYFEPLLAAEAHMAFGLTEPDHGSDPTWMDATARRDGDDWVVTGTKAFVTNAVTADFFMVHARTSGHDGDVDGLSTFIVDADDPDLEIGTIHRSMGTRPGRQATIHLTDCRVPAAHLVGEEGTGFRTAMTWVGGGRLAIPAQAVGFAQWMFDRSVAYAKQRRTFGKPIGTRQHVQDHLVEMRIEIEAVRWLYRYAAWLIDRGEEHRWLQSAAKLRGSRLWCDVADRAIQIHGGAGYMRSLPFEGLYRDGRGTRIYEGTDEIQKRTIATQLLGL